MIKKANKYNQGFYKPKHPEKYKGKSNNIIYRSGWELKVMKYFDSHPDVVEWASEEYWFVVPYRNPVTGKMHRYFPDFWFKQINSDGTFTQTLVEVKPEKQTKQPPRTKKGVLDKRYMQQAMTYAINRAKWDATEEYVKKRGWNFLIITEKNLP